jgi:hypothetical protein
LTWGQLSVKIVCRLCVDHVWLFQYEDTPNMTDFPLLPGEEVLHSDGAATLTNLRLVAVDITSCSPQSPPSSLSTRSSGPVGRRRSGPPQCVAAAVAVFLGLGMGIPRRPGRRWPAVSRRPSPSSSTRETPSPNLRITYAGRRPAHRTRQAGVAGPGHHRGRKGAPGRGRPGEVEGARPSPSRSTRALTRNSVGGSGREGIGADALRPQRRGGASGRRAGWALLKA